MVEIKHFHGDDLLVAKALIWNGTTGAHDIPALQHHAKVLRAASSADHRHRLAGRSANQQG
jgi:hypothetical protein